MKAYNISKERIESDMDIVKVIRNMRTFKILLKSFLMTEQVKFECAHQNRNVIDLVTSEDEFHSTEKDQDENEINEENAETVEQEQIGQKTPIKNSAKASEKNKKISSLKKFEELQRAKVLAEFASISAKKDIYQQAQNKWSSIGTSNDSPSGKATRAILPLAPNGDQQVNQIELSHLPAKSNNSLQIMTQKMMMGRIKDKVQKQYNMMKIKNAISNHFLTNFMDQNEDNNFQSGSTLLQPQMFYNRQKSY